jgi:hypothetical protein
LAGPAPAQTISYAEAINHLMGACGGDIDNYCSQVHLGSGRIEACLAQHVSQVSEQCKATFAQVLASIDARATAQSAAPKLCDGDIQRLCRRMRNVGWAVSCLTRPENVRRVSRKCNDALTNAGWR